MVLKFFPKPDQPRLSSAELESHLEQTLDPVLSSRRSVTPTARALAYQDTETQQFVMHWLKVICATNAELGFRFISLSEQALEKMDLDGVESWVINALDVYDRQGLYPGVNELESLERFSTRLKMERQTVHLNEQSTILERYLRGLSGRELRVATSDHAHTDTRTAYLPEQLNRFASQSDNLLLYKAMATHLWAMSRFGTFRKPEPGAPSLHEQLLERGQDHRITGLFQALEAERLNACIARELPGLNRAVESRLGTQRHTSETWRDAARDLQRPKATVQDTLAWLDKILATNEGLPDQYAFQGSIDFARAAEVQEQRLEEEKSALQELVEDLIDQMDRDPSETMVEEDNSLELQLEAGEDGENLQYQLTMQGKSLAMSVELKERLDSILQDLETVPDDWLNPESASEDMSQRETGEIDESNDNQDPVFYYDEWDHQRKHYRKNWCTLFERKTGHQDPQFVEQTLTKYAGVVTDLRRTFELLRGENQVLRRQPFGEDIDIDATVEASSDRLLGREVSDRLFLKTHRNVRDIAVMFMVDLSGSTKGWINEAERESLVLLCEALEVLGDRYGIYGFSGMTRKRCEIFRIKTMEENYDERVKSRIAAIHPRDYTRMGVTIRHLTSLMEKTDARTRLLITLSDGKPDDYDGYRGEYGIEDTRQALIEARNLGIHPFCITIDKHAGEYLPHMYGAVNYTVVDDVRKLPREVSEVYCRLTR